MEPGSKAVASSEFSERWESYWTHDGHRIQVRTSTFRRLLHRIAEVRQA